jgi:molybdopterin converting factor small subunit
MAKVLIPTSMRKLTAGQGTVVVPGGSFDELLANLEAQSPGMAEQLCGEGGRVRDYILVFVNGEQVQGARLDDTVIAQGDEVQFVPAVAGG